MNEKGGGERKKHLRYHFHSGSKLLAKSLRVLVKSSHFYFLTSQSQANPVLCAVLDYNVKWQNVSYSCFSLPWHGLLRVWDLGPQMLIDACLNREVSCHRGLGNEDFIGGKEEDDGDMDTRENGSMWLL